MGGQIHQSNAAAAAALYDAGLASSDTSDAVMARWLQSAGLQHLASPLASTGIDHRLLSNLLMQKPLKLNLGTSNCITTCLLVGFVVEL
ncbi:kinesin-like protein KIN-13A isoform X2 [Magnolia sinica]|uniref:kinesin-like protein KIN-13A isoform X2 n=1 Tax=Magnolia sinica TaxID=86752 RepID=UPI00265B3A24|nr:kinesin-like protein KIN-13A isoform X2 [Magnolia sinica]